MKTKIKIAAIFTFAVSACVFSATKGNTQTKVETAGQKFKSIKVLNEMPADQMGKVMNMMSASLGVNCAFCHASNDGDYEKEGFEHKDIAREMLKMTFDINKNYFEGKSEINCNTCHQGKPHPQAVFPLTPSTREPRQAQPKDKPTVEDILAKYESAIGGKNNLSKINSRYIKAQRLEPDGKSFEAEEILQKGAKMSVATIYPSKQYGDYTVKEIFDGKIAKKFGNNAEIALKTDEADAIKREAEIFANANLQAVYPKLEFFRLEKIDGKEVYAVEAADKLERFYFDVLSGLLVRRTAATTTVLGDHVFQVDYLDYKDFGGVKLPTTIKFAVPQIYWTRKILAVENNVKIDDAKFTK